MDDSGREYAMIDRVHMGDLQRLSKVEDKIRKVLEKDYPEEYQYIRITFFQYYQNHQYLGEYKGMNLPVSELSDEEIEAREILTSSFRVRSANCAYANSFYEWGDRIPVSNENMRRIRAKLAGKMSPGSWGGWVRPEPSFFIDGTSKRFYPHNVVSVYSESFSAPSYITVANTNYGELPFDEIREIAELQLGRHRALLLHGIRHYFSANFERWVLILDNGTVKEYSES